MGADRIVNVLAAVALYRADTIVVDFGTATTFDCITADSRFIGGVIMPGLRTSSDQLTRRTAKLRPPRLGQGWAGVIGQHTRSVYRPVSSTGQPEAVVSGQCGGFGRNGPVQRRRGWWQQGGLAAVVAPLTTFDRRDPSPISPSRGSGSPPAISA